MGSTLVLGSWPYGFGEGLALVPQFLHLPNGGSYTPPRGAVVEMGAQMPVGPSGSPTWGHLGVLPRLFIPFALTLVTALHNAADFVPGRVPGSQGSVACVLDAWMQPADSEAGRHVSLRSFASPVWNGESRVCPFRNRQAMRRWGQERGGASWVLCQAPPPKARSFLSHVAPTPVLMEHLCW